MVFPSSNSHCEIRSPSKTHSNNQAMKQLLLYIFLFLSLSAFAQNKSILVEGAVADSSGIGLPSASVALLQPKDSVLHAFGLSDKDGRFTIKRVAPGEYLLQITYLGYRTHYQSVSVPADQPKISLPRILMAPSSTLLDAVDITAQQMPLRIRKDTIEYNAGAFQTQPGSVVEDLLRKLPGVEVQQDGSIKAQGETVQNVLVEGKEFFGNDPKIATKNLPADAVDKVQVFDKKSEMAEFTGIEDGRDQKTINLKLKEDKKQGYFGNVSAGYGTEERYQGKFSVNRFSKKMQLSAIGAANNINEQAFSFEDYINVMGGLSNFMTGGGSGRVRIEINEDSGIPLPGNVNRGFTDNQAVGLNLNYEFSPKTELNGHYFFNRIQNDLDRLATRQNLLDMGNFGSSDHELRNSENMNHRLNLTLRHKIDSFQNIIARTNLSFNDAGLLSDLNARTYDALNILQNNSTRLFDSDGNNLRGDAAFTYRRRFGRKGRALVADLTYRTGNDTRLARLSAANTFYTGGQDSTGYVRQRQQYANETENYGASLSYTEPLGKQQYLELRAARQQYTNNTDKDFYDLVEVPTPGEVFNPLLSNQFRRGYRYDRAGLNYMRNRKKYNLTAGAALQNSVLDGTLAGSEETLSRHFTRVMPSLFYNYEPQMGRNFAVEYTTDLREPSLEQLQPVVDNSDPLNIYIGNPDLQPEYAHNLELRMMRFDQFSMTSFFATLAANYVTNRITNASTVDELFRRTIRPVNVARDITLNGYFNFGKPIRPIRSNLNLGLSSTYNRGILFVNDVENNTDRWQHTFNLELDNRKKERLDVSAGARFLLNSTRYSVSEALNQQFLNQQYHADVTVFPGKGKKWAIGTGLDYSIYSAEAFGQETSIPLWRASIVHYMLKNKRGQLKLSAADLLKRNLGISRSSQFNYLEEERIVSLSRYFMLSFAYSLSGFGNERGGFEMRVIR